jgi:uncharacterized protein DUF4395
MASITAFGRSSLDLQGFTCLDDETKARANLPLRFTPALCLSATVAGAVLASPVVLGALAAAAGMALLLPGGHPFDYLYNYGVRFWVAQPRLPRNPRPRRFAFIMAIPVLGTSALAFALGAPILGYLLAAIQVAGCLTYVATGFCVASWMHSRLVGRVVVEDVSVRVAEVI